MAFSTWPGIAVNIHDVAALGPPAAVTLPRFSLLTSGREPATPPGPFGPGGASPWKTSWPRPSIWCAERAVAGFGAVARPSRRFARDIGGCRWRRLWGGVEPCLRSCLVPRGRAKSRRLSRRGSTPSVEDRAHAAATRRYGHSRPNEIGRPIVQASHFEQPFVVYPPSAGHCRPPGGKLDSGLMQRPRLVPVEKRASERLHVL